MTFDLAHGPTAQVTPGTVLLGKYRVNALLGRGAMGSVWRATHLDLDAPVALKLIDRSIASSPEALARFRREAKAAASLRSPHVVQILDHGVDPELDVPFIVMELLEGETLSRRLERVVRLSPAETAHVVSQLAKALAKAHQAGIVHRDLKPENVFLVHDYDEDVVKVLDFGVAKADGRTLLPSTQAGVLIGTPYYMSPEHIKGQPVDQRADLWALGVIAVECMTGVLPFRADSLAELTHAICDGPAPRPSLLGPVPPGFDAWCERALSRDPAARFATAFELSQSLNAICGYVASRPSQPGARSSSAGFRSGLTVRGVGAVPSVAPPAAQDLRRSVGPLSQTLRIPLERWGSWGAGALLFGVGLSISLLLLFALRSRELTPATLDAPEVNGSAPPAPGRTDDSAHHDSKQPGVSASPDSPGASGGEPSHTGRVDERDAKGSLRDPGDPASATGSGPVNPTAPIGAGPTPKAPKSPAQSGRSPSSPPSAPPAAPVIPTPTPSVGAGPKPNKPAHGGLLDSRH